MNVVGYSEAARIIGVSRQAINSLKRVNKEQEGKYPFFCFDSKTGKAGIDIDHPDWLDYSGRNQTLRDKFNTGKEQADGAGSKDSQGGKEDNAAFSALITACTESVKELFNPSAGQIEELNEMIKNKFGEMMGNV